MSDKPILFSGEMVRAILEGRKTVTRRVAKEVFRSPPKAPFHIYGTLPFHTWQVADGGPYFILKYTPGDLLWVRESASFVAMGDGPPVVDLYKADADTSQIAVRRWRPSIHMPRWASRITLEVTAVKVERLQDISEEDANSEGVGVTSAGEAQGWTAQVLFKHLWDSINAKRPGCAWSDNPWVAAYTFRRIKP